MLAKAALLDISPGHLSGSMAAALWHQLDEASSVEAVDTALARAAGLRREALRVSLPVKLPVIVISLPLEPECRD